MFNQLKLMCAIVVVAVASLLVSPLPKATASGDIHMMKNVSIVINGNKVNFQDPIVSKSNTLLLPMRAFYESIGASVTWNDATQTASATRNGKKVDLTIHSKRAFVDGNPVAMTIAPQNYKNKTYIPLRFVSENLDGKVIWNAAEQTVQISIAGKIPPPAYAGPYILHMNDKRVVMTEAIVTKQGKSYIPAEYFLNYIEDTSGKWLSKEKYELTLSWVSFVFTEGSSRVTVNGTSQIMEEKPFVQNGKMFVPINYLMNELGGSLRYIKEKREMYVYLYHHMYTSAFLDKSPGTTPRPQLVPSAKLEGNRSLLLSDNPETLKVSYVPSANATLSEQHVQSTAAVNEHRVYGWHYNELGRTAKIGITIENKSSTESIEIAGSKGISHKSGNGWIIHDLGLYIADATLNGKLKTSASKDLVIAPGETKVIESFELFNHYLVGFLQDIDVRAVNGGATDYTIRVVVTRVDSDLETIHSEAVPTVPNATHPRGAWAQSTIATEFPVYTVGLPVAGYNVSNGKTDHLLTAENSISQGKISTGNVGHYGMNYKIKIPIDNPTGAPATVKITLAGRGGLYSGALKMNGKVYLVPAVRPGQDFAELADYVVTGTSDTIELEVMHAGGVSLPLAVYVGTK